MIMFDNLNFDQVIRDPGYRHLNKGILVYNICLIRICNSVSDGVTSKSLLNIETCSAINSGSEYEPDVLNTSCATGV